MDEEWDWFDSLPGDAQEEIGLLHRIALAVAEPMRLVPMGQCPFCEAELEGKHTAACPVTLARQYRDQQTAKQGE